MSPKIRLLLGDVEGSDCSCNYFQRFTSHSCQYVCSLLWIKDSKKTVTLDWIIAHQGIILSTQRIGKNENFLYRINFGINSFDIIKKIKTKYPIIINETNSMLECIFYRADIYSLSTNERHWLSLLKNGFKKKHDDPHAHELFCPSSSNNKDKKTDAANTGLPTQETDEYKYKEGDDYCEYEYESKIELCDDLKDLLGELEDYSENLVRSNNSGWFYPDVDGSTIGDRLGKYDPGL